jgi:hypothetical protein
VVAAILRHVLLLFEREGERELGRKGKEELAL